MPGGEKRKILSKDGAEGMAYQESLFSQNVNRPLADRLRPTDLDQTVGQEHLRGEGAPLRRMIVSGYANHLPFGADGIADEFYQLIQPTIVDAGGL